MTQNGNGLLFALLRSAITGEKLTEEELAGYSERLLPKLYVLSRAHDIAHLVGMGLVLNELQRDENDFSAKFAQEILNSVYRYEQLNYELHCVCVALEEAEIPFIPLKGAVIRQYYPIPYMRTSCDVDVLVRNEDVERAATRLVEKCNYKRDRGDTHEVSLYTQSGLHIELHYDLVEDGLVNQSSSVLNTVWEQSIPHGNYKYRRDLPDETFYFYHIAHMAKHIKNGGCGVRSLIDLWILNRLEEGNAEKRTQLLDRGNLTRFAAVACKLSRVWFEGEETELEVQKLEKFILMGGVYGSHQNQLQIVQYKKGGRFKYIWYRIFIPFRFLQQRYPILYKHKWLAPFMQVRRWFGIFFDGRLKRAVDDIKLNQRTSSKETKEFLDSIGL